MIIQVLRITQHRLKEATSVLLKFSSCCSVFTQDVVSIQSAFPSVYFSAFGKGLYKCQCVMCYAFGAKVNRGCIAAHRNVTC